MTRHCRIGLGLFISGCGRRIFYTKEIRVCGYGQSSQGHVYRPLVSRVPLIMALYNLFIIIIIIILFYDLNVDSGR